MPASPHLIGDHLALDFLNSRVGPDAGGAGDWLADGTRFVDWLVAAGAVDSSGARQVAGRKGAALYPTSRNRVSSATRRSRVAASRVSLSACRRFGAGRPTQVRDDVAIELAGP